MKYGALKYKIDKRDYCLKSGVSDFPKSFLCENMSEVKNQRNINSCVAHATSTILETLNKVETGKDVKLSTDFIYGMQGVAYSRLDQGMYLRDACKIVKKYGDPEESVISGNTEQPKCTTKLKSKLNDTVYKQAYAYHIDSFAYCASTSDIKHALMNYGPVMASVDWFDRYTIDENNVIHMGSNCESGGHAIVICGWNEYGWVCQNSWGKTWNKNGKFIYSYDDKLNEAWSFVDASNEDVNVPKTNKILDLLYKILNFILNLLKLSK